MVGRKAKQEKIMATPSVLVRVALEKELVDQAKHACGEDFRGILDSARKKGLLKQIEQHLLAAGLIAAEKKGEEKEGDEKAKKAKKRTRAGVKYRVRAMSPETLEELDQIRQHTGIDRNTLIRAALVLSGSQPPEEAASPESPLVVPSPAEPSRPG